jgi:hypothetical protein
MSADDALYFRIAAVTGVDVAFAGDVDREPKGNQSIQSGIESSDEWCGESIFSSSPCQV